MAFLHIKNGPGERERMKAFTLNAIQSTMLNIAGDTPTLLEVVAGGQFRWRHTFARAFAGLPVDDQIALAMFAFFCDQVERRFGHAMRAAEMLDALEVAAPPSQREIDDAWEVESFSSEEGRRYFYGPDGHPEELIKRLRD